MGQRQGPQPDPRWGAGRPDACLLTRAEVLAAYGLTDGDVEVAVNRWRQRRRDRATEEEDSFESEG